MIDRILILIGISLSAVSIYYLIAFFLNDTNLNAYLAIIGLISAFLSIYDFLRKK